MVVKRENEKVDWSMQLDSVELTEINPIYESGYIKICLTNKYRVVVENLMMNKERRTVHDVWSLTSSRLISEEIQNLVSPLFTTYCVSDLLSSMNLHPVCCDCLKREIVSFVVETAVRAKKEGVKLFGVMADLEVIIVDELIEESEESNEEEKENYEGGVFGKNCVMCLEDFSVGSEITCMPCSHIFHRGCLVRWLQGRNSCPLCRREVSSSFFD